MKKNNSVQFHRIARTVFSLSLAIVIAISSGVDVNWAATKKTTQKTSNTTTQITEPKVDAGSYVVMSGSTSEIVYEHYADRKLSIGDITKLMTAMIVIDNMHDEGEYSYRVTIKDKLKEYGKEFKPGDSVTVEDLMVAMLVDGSDVAAEALAGYNGKRKNFISLMNSKAVAMGLEKTHFANPSGRYDYSHYATAKECAVMMQYAIRYPKIKEILSSVTIPEHYSYVNGSILGMMEAPSKTAQYVGIATKNEMQFIVVMLEANRKHITDGAIDLFEYGDYKASKNTIVKAGKYMGRAKVKGGNITRVKAYTETKGFAYIPPEGSTDLVQTETVLTSGLKAPLAEGAKVGELRIYVADELKGTVDLVTNKEVKKGWPLSNIYISNFATVMTVVIILLAVYLLMRVRAANKRKARRIALERKIKIREEAIKQAALDEDRKRRKWTYSNYYDSKDMNDVMDRNRKK